jgi:hypothetical protein
VRVGAKPCGARSWPGCIQDALLPAERGWSAEMRHVTGDGQRQRVQRGGMQLRRCNKCCIQSGWRSGRKAPSYGGVLALSGDALHATVPQPGAAHQYARQPLSSCCFLIPLPITWTMRSKSTVRSSCRHRHWRQHRWPERQQLHSSSRPWSASCTAAAGSASTKLENLRKTQTGGTRLEHSDCWLAGLKAHKGGDAPESNAYQCRNGQPTTGAQT